MSWDLSAVVGFALTGFFLLLLHLVKKQILKEEQKELELYAPFAEIEIDVYLILSLLSFFVLSHVVSQVIAVNNTGGLDVLESITYWWAFGFGIIILFRSIGIVWKTALVGFKEFEKLTMGINDLEEGIHGDKGFK